MYWVFACARLADVAVRGVELQQRRSADRFGGSSLRRRACGASDDQTAKWPSTEYTVFGLSRQVRNTNGKASLAPRTRCCHGTPSSLHVSLQVARAFRCVGLHLFSSIFRTGSYSQSANGRMVGSPLLGTRSTMHLSDSRPAPAFSCPPGPGETLSL